MPQKTPAATTPVQTADTFVELGAGDRAAIVAHIESLTEADYELRFGRRRSPEGIQSTASGLIQKASLFGLWDAGHTRLLVLGSYARVTSATTPDTVELSLSALPEIRGGVGQRVANWLQSRFVAQGFKRVELSFYASNQPVVQLASQMGMKVTYSMGHGVAHLDLKPTADAIHDWLDRLDQLLEAVRNAPASGPTAKL